MTLKEAAGYLGWCVATVRRGLAGTDKLTPIRRGKSGCRRIFFIRAEVVAYKQDEINRALREAGKSDRLLDRIYGVA
jgi:hypothetical protein